jgi:hypothetical protein
VLVVHKPDFDLEFNECVIDSLIDKNSLIESVEYNKKNIKPSIEKTNLHQPIVSDYYNESVYDSLTVEDSLLDSIIYNNTVIKPSIEKTNSHKPMLDFYYNEYITDSLTNEKSLSDNIEYINQSRLDNSKQDQNLNNNILNSELDSPAVYDSITNENLSDIKEKNKDSNILLANENENSILTLNSTSEVTSSDLFNETVLDSITDEESLSNSSKLDKTQDMIKNSDNEIVDASLSNVIYSETILDSITDEESLRRRTDSQELSSKDSAINSTPEQELLSQDLSGFLYNETILDSITNNNLLIANNNKERDKEEIKNQTLQVQKNEAVLNKEDNNEVINQPLNNKNNSELVISELNTSDELENSKQKPIISVNSLSVEFPTKQGTVVAVDKVDLELYNSEILGLVGESGSGKTTIGRAIMGLQDYNSGSIDILGQRIPNKVDNITPAFNR